MPSNLSLIQSFFHALFLKKVKEPFLKNNVSFIPYSSLSPEKSPIVNIQPVSNFNSKRDHAYLKHLPTFISSLPKAKDWRHDNCRMFTSKGLFSDVVCPYQENCLLPGCMFSHPKPAELASAPVAVETKQPQKEKFIPEEECKEVKPPKRPLEPERSVVTRKPNTLTKSSLVTKERTFVGEPVSPPPLRRKALNGSAVPVAKQSTENDTSNSKPQIVQQPKKEGLNPRALKTKCKFFRPVCQ